MAIFSFAPAGTLSHEKTPAVRLNHEKPAGAASGLTRPKMNASRMSTDSTSPKEPTPADGEPSPLRSVHTTSFPDILEQLGSSLLVTTYQAGKLVVLRSDAGVINTHFRAFNKPMGMAVGRGRLGIGTAVDVWEFRNVPAVAAKLEPTGKHDGASCRDQHT